MNKKFETLPHSGESNYLLVSMQSTWEIMENLEKFPRKGQSKVQKECVATLLWSGVKENNTPINISDQNGVGVVLNPKHLNIPQADLEDSSSILAKNIWRESFRNKHQTSFNLELMRPGQVRCFQKESQNPIAGLVVTRCIDINIAARLKSQLEKNPQLNLYFYDVTAKEHLVRYIDNTKAIAYFDRISQQKEHTEEEFKLAFERALPFGGFDKDPLSIMDLSDIQIDELTPGIFTSGLNEKLSQIRNPSANLEALILVADIAYRQRYNSLKKNLNLGSFHLLVNEAKNLFKELKFGNSECDLKLFIKSVLQGTIVNEVQRIYDFQSKGFTNIHSENKAYVKDQLAIILKKVKDHQKSDDIKVLTDLADFLVALNTALEDPTEAHIAECKQLAEGTIGGYSWGTTIVGATLILLGLLTMAIAPVVSIATTAASFGLSGPLSIIGGVGIGASGLSMFSSGVYWLRKGLQKTPEVDEVLDPLRSTVCD